MRTKFVVSKKDDASFLNRFETGLKEAKMMQNGKLPKKPLDKFYGVGK